MSSSFMAGDAADRSIEVKKMPCPKAKDGKHEWMVHNPNSPSKYEVCTHCDYHCYYK